jgi:hypothetical protein
MIERIFAEFRASVDAFYKVSAPKYRPPEPHDQRLTRFLLVQFRRRLFRERTLRMFNLPPEVMAFLVKVQFLLGFAVSASMKSPGNHENHGCPACSG